MVEPRRAIVRPRVISPTSGESLLLEEEILSLIERKQHGTVWLEGEQGAGKTTALAHLAAVLPPAANAVLLDDFWQYVEPDRLVVACGSPNIKPMNPLATYELAPWTDDELIEYLLAAQREACQSVMRRCRSADDKDRLRGNANPGQPICTDLLI
jgi:energy-coupling factor transporter ATP-binding protein EcfA2